MKEEVHRRTIERTQKQKVTDGKKILINKWRLCVRITDGCLISCFNCGFHVFVFVLRSLAAVAPQHGIFLC